MIIFAPNINSGGGLILLIDLVKSLKRDNVQVLFLDARARDTIGPLVAGLRVNWVQANLKDRLVAELMLKKISTSKNRILCFNGVPPLFRCKGKIFVYLQNCLLLSNERFNFPLKTRLRLYYEKCVLRSGHKRVSAFFVQTETMASNLSEWLRKKGQEPDGLVTVAPFSNITKSQKLLSQNGHQTEARHGQKTYDFCYVADGQPHKNHVGLFNALRYLANRNEFPQVAVTLGPNEASLISMIKKLQDEHNVQIFNLGKLKHQDVFKLYQDSKALVYPSLAESYGLPLLEAQRLGLPIVAGELDYVRDVCKPQETFNPHQELSIARALLRFLGKSESLTKTLTANQFLSLVLR